MVRKFKYNENVYDDPGAEFSIEDVRTHLTQFFPELAQATYTEKTLDNGDVEITFAKKVGVKGSILHRYQVNGEVVWINDDGNEEVDDLDMRIEANSPEEAADKALARFGEQHNIIAFWSEDIPPDIEDLGEIPVDVMMRRQGQPMLPVVPA